MASTSEEAPRAADGAMSSNTTTTTTTTAAEQKVQHCLRILQGKSDEHKFAGLLMVAKLNDLPLERLQQVRRQVLATVGVKFFLRLLHTRGAETDESLSSFQTLGLNLIASFCSDTEIAETFADEQLVRFLLEQLESSCTAQQAQDDCVAILHGVVVTEKGKRLLLHESTLVHAVRVLEKRSQDALATQSTAAAASNEDADTKSTAAIKTIAALWSLLGQLASDAAFWNTLHDVDVAFICGSLARSPGGRVSLAVLAVLNKLMALIEQGAVAFTLLQPYLTVLRQGVLQFLRSKWPHQERDACLELVHDLMNHAGGKFLLVVLKLVSIEIKLLLDDVELALVQMEEKQVERMDEAERQEREVARALHVLPVCFSIVEMAISTLVASLGDDSDDDDDADANTPLLLPYDVLLELKQALAQTFTVIFEFLTLAREYMQTHRFRELQTRGAASVVQLDAVVFASVRVVSAWIAEDSDSCMAQLVTLAPFLVLYKPLAAVSTMQAVVASPGPTLELSANGSRHAAASVIVTAAECSSGDSAVESDDELDSDDEVDGDGNRVPAMAASADLTKQQAATTTQSVDPLHFLLPGLLQLSATPDGAAALTQDAAVLRRLLHFCCALCSVGVDNDDGNGTRNGNGSNGDDCDGDSNAPNLPTLTLCLGMLVNLLLEKDGPALSSASVTSTRNERFPHASEWRRALAFLLPLACASGATVVHDTALTMDDRGDDDQYVMLLHVVCVVLLIASHAGANSSSNNSVASLTKLVAPFNELVAWLLRHPPSADSETATELFELVRILSLRTRMTKQILQM